MRKNTRQKIGNIVGILLGILWIYMSVSRMYVGNMNLVMGILGGLHIILNLWILLVENKK